MSNEKGQEFKIYLPKYTIHETQTEENGLRYKNSKQAQHSRQERKLNELL